MKKAFTFLLLLIGLSGLAQISERSVISSAGEEFERSNFSITWTLGEPVIKTIEDPNNLITQGFHQTIFIISSIEEELPQIAADFKVFPNPASTYFNLEVFNADPNKFEFFLFDIKGTLVQSGNLMENPQRFDLSQLSNTNYIFKIIEKDSGLSKSFKIQKTQ